MNNPINDFEMIKLIENYPMLYDRSFGRGAKNAARKDEAWKEVSQALNASERACIVRWKSIRDRFSKEYRRVQDNPNEPTNWDMFPHLLFLIDHFKHGQAKSDVICNIKVASKGRRRKINNRNLGDGSQAEDDSYNDEEIHPDEMIANQQLIALVKDHPVLYDKHKIRDSKNLTAKNDAWIGISQCLGISEEICFKRWKKLRDRFARECRYHHIYPQKPITWIYYEDLIFLEQHYRKGIPLNVENLKRKPKLLDTSENPWENDFAFDCIEEDQTPLDEQCEIIDNKEEKRTEIDDIILIPVNQEAPIEKEDDELVELIVEKQTPVEESQQQLGCVIFNMENVLRQSQDCLKALQQEKERHKQELLESSELCAQSGILQKVQILLKDLAEEKRTSAERKILQFLCECQIKTLNNQEVEDVCSEDLYEKTL